MQLPAFVAAPGKALQLTGLVRDDPIQQLAGVLKLTFLDQSPRLCRDWVVLVAAQAFEQLRVLLQVLLGLLPHLLEF